MHCYTVLEGFAVRGLRAERVVQSTLILYSRQAYSNIVVKPTSMFIRLVHSTAYYLSYSTLERDPHSLNPNPSFQLSLLLHVTY